MGEHGARPGLVGELHRTVGEVDTALALGSGDVEVLATPRLIAWLEEATCCAIAEGLPSHLTSVGTRVEVEHLRASVVGAGVVARAVVTHVDGSEVRFAVTATQDERLIARGQVYRVVVDRARFLARATGSSLPGLPGEAGQGIGGEAAP